MSEPAKMSCPEFVALCAARSLDLLEGQERAAFDAHRASPGPHEGCLEALAAAEQTASRLAEALSPAVVRASVWEAIDKQIDILSTRRAPAVPTQKTPRWRRALPWLLAAAALVIAIGLARSRAAQMERVDQLARQIEEQANARTILQQERDDARGRLGLRDTAVELLAQPSTRVVALAPQAGAPAGLAGSALVSFERATAIVVVTAAQAPAGKDFELWVIHGDEKRPAGLLRGEAATPLIARVGARVVMGAEAFAVTIEDHGGSTTPRGPIVLLGVLPKG